MMSTYKTAEVAAIIGIRPSTVHLHEKPKLIPELEHLANGYHVFTELHVMQCKLVRTAFQIEILQNGLRKKTARMITVAATKGSDTAIMFTEDYLKQLRQERNHAEEMIEIVETILAGDESENTQCLKCEKVSEILKISMDALRNWGMNGLLTVRRKNNGYRVYTGENIQRLKIICSLRCANYSLEAILRLLQQLSKNPDTDIHATLNTPKRTDSIISVRDRLIVSLLLAERSADTPLQMLKEVQTKFLQPYALPPMFPLVVFFFHKNKGGLDYTNCNQSRAVVKSP